MPEPTMSSMSGTPVGLLRDSLRGSRGPLLRMLAWSLLSAGPAAAAGLATAQALDHGFLTNQPLTGFAWLAVLAILHPLRAYAERAMFPHLAAIVEPMRDRLTHHVVHGTLTRATHHDRRVDIAAVTRLTRHVETIRNLVATLLRTARPLAVTIVAAMIGLTALSPATTLYVVPPLLLALAALPLAVRLLLTRRMRLIIAEEHIAVRTSTILTASRDLTAIGAEQPALTDIRHAGDTYTTATVAIAGVSTLRLLIILIGGYTPIIGLLLAAPHLLDTGQLTTGTLIGALTYLTAHLLPALQALTGTITDYWTQLHVTLTRLAQETTTTQPPPGGITTITGHDLVTRDLTFAYGAHADPVLHNLTLTISAGEHLTIVGASGIGKSTLANLLAGLEHPTNGTVELGGTPVTNLDPHLRPRLVTLVPQEAYVFTGTLRENLTYLNPAISDAVLDRAAAALGFTPIATRLGGYHTPITDPTTQLSAGERQLLVLVRAYISPAPIAILDEATCHLDPTAEAKAETAFAKRPGTLIVIAHRIDSARRAKRILLLNGHHTHHGTHTELLTTNTTYADLVGHWTPAAQTASDVRNLHQ